MSEEVPDRAAAAAVAEAFADEEDRCVGEFGEILEARRDDGTWIVEFSTHTFSEEYTHRLRITASVGNVVSYDRESKFD